MVLSLQRRWEETVRLKERVLKQRDHLVRLEKEQRQLMDRMTAFQTETTELVTKCCFNLYRCFKESKNLYIRNSLNDGKVYYYLLTINML